MERSIDPAFRFVQQGDQYAMLELAPTEEQAEYYAQAATALRGEGIEIGVEKLPREIAGLDYLSYALSDDQDASRRRKHLELFVSSVLSARVGGSVLKIAVKSASDEEATAKMLRFERTLLKIRRDNAVKKVKAAQARAAQTAASQQGGEFNI